MKLKNKIITATIKAGGSPNITAKDLFDKSVLDSMAKRYGIFEVLGFSKDVYPPMKTVMDKVRYLYIRKLMLDAEGNISKACRIGGITRSGLYSLARKLHLNLKDL